ncbi:MAG: histidine phosphatase family protein [Clostridia bacterium]|nr:histidine phosphatase family protein [Clostridia bacterium]
MKLVFIRHGEPDYEHDTLTEKGMREAELLRPRVKKIHADEYYASPLGRAALTAKIALEGTGITPVTLDYMREFHCPVYHDDIDRSKVPWDFLPEVFLSDERCLDRNEWFKADHFRGAPIKEEYDFVTGEFDKLLAEHGYRRRGLYYEAERPNDGTLAFFCHFGVTAVIVSHLVNISPVPLWQGFVALTTSVTTCVTEERRPGKAVFRVNSFGDISHLYAADEEPSFMARFCEVYGDGTRQD